MSVTCRVGPGRLVAAVLLALLCDGSAVPVKVRDGVDTGRPETELKKTLERAAAMGARQRLAALQTGVQQPNQVLEQSGMTPAQQEQLRNKQEIAQQHLQAHHAGAVQAVQRPGPEISGRFLTHSELAPIRSVRCLHEKQRNPNKPCPPEEEKPDFDLSAIGLSHYPHYKDSVCHSNQEFFCDPTKILSPAAQDKTQERLRLFKERTLVNCGQLESVLDPHPYQSPERRSYEKKNPIFSGRLGLQQYREFNLAVVLADEWPSTTRDPDSMQTFGWRIMTQWGLQPIYNGVDNGNPVNEFRRSWDGYRSNCPTTAVLIILPRYHDAFLTSPSCEFICQTRGGPEVVAATLEGLDRGGVEAAIQAGIDQIGKVLDATIPSSTQKDAEFMAWRRNAHDRAKDAAQSDVALVWTVRLLYGFVIFILLVSIAAFFYWVFLPEEKRPRSRHLLASDVDAVWVRKNIRSELDRQEGI